MAIDNKNVFHVNVIKFLRLLVFSLLIFLIIGICLLLFFPNSNFINNLGITGNKLLLTIINGIFILMSVIYSLTMGIVFKKMVLIKYKHFTKKQIQTIDRAKLIGIVFIIFSSLAILNTLFVIIFNILPFMQTINFLDQGAIQIISLTILIDIIYLSSSIFLTIYSIKIKDQFLECR